MRRYLALYLACFLCATCAARAHELRPVFLNVTEIAPERYAITWKVPARGDYKMALSVRLPDACKQIGEPVAGFVDSAHVSRWQAECAGGLAGRIISVDGLSATYTDALVKIAKLNGTTQTTRLSPAEPRLAVADDPNSWDTGRTYFLLGVEHILEGIDHLLFVFALLLLIRKPRMLLLTITSFTVAHSITLAAASLGLFSLPQPPVEALIALSIMFVASEIIRSGQEREHLSTRYPWLISFIFGLLHGLGFSGALREIGLPQVDVPLALLTFNLGVEAGQLSFIIVALLTMLGIRCVMKVDVRRVRYWLAYMIGSLSAFWLVQRVAGF
jgi:hydrogenase/urease accessory protein HupE